MVSNLRNMAVDMSAEISDQNEQLERITLKVKGGRGLLHLISLEKSGLRLGSREFLKAPQQGTFIRTLDAVEAN